MQRIVLGRTARMVGETDFEENIPGVKRFAPSKDWWSEDDDSDGGWYVSDVAASKDFVAASGQDPYDTAVVLVWTPRAESHFAGSK